MIDPVQLWRTAGDSGGKMIAVLSGLIALLFGFAFLGTSAFHLPFAAMILASIAVAGAIAFILWTPLAMRRDGVNVGGALLVGGLSPLLGMICLDVMGVLLLAPAGSGGGLSSSVLFNFWQLGVAGVLAGVAAAFVTSTYVKRRFVHLNVSGIRTD